VKLLFDEHLSRRLPERLADVFPESSDVLTAGLGGAPDVVIWEHAKTGGYVLVTKDEDFQRLSVLHGAPPKVIWLRIGNAGTADVARLLRFRVEQIRIFVDDPETAFLALG
jgi:predicted nuclease of predicted toxin-antitoxin system